MIERKADFTRALERLCRRDPESLAAFILSLAQVSGPIGEQVRTFIVGDDVKETVGSLRERIGELRAPTESENRRRLGQEIGERLELILDAIETLVLPADPKKAFDLLVRVFETDAVAMENCGDHEFEAACAFERAGELIARVAQSLPQAGVVAELEALLDDDGYGVRGVLTELVARRGED